jgi:hypothetical protein
MLSLILLFLLNILFVAALWHVTVNYQIQKLGQKKTGGVLKISSETAFILSEYCLVLILFLIDILFVVMFWSKAG